MTTAKQPSPLSLAELQKIFQPLGFQQVSFTPLERPQSLELYREWLERGFHGDMGYLEDHFEFKEQPRKLLASARAAIVLTHNYVPHPKPSATSPLKVALYAQGDDYHQWLNEKLARGVEQLKRRFPSEDFLHMTDSKPVLERDLAHKAGLGWVGKNTCLISQEHGSLFFIAEIYTSLECRVQISPAADRCGTCTRCLEACPTEALIAERQLDARKCISYLTIESKTSPAENLREKMGDWFFGCDLCQTVCPWNQKLWSDQLSSTSGNAPVSPPLERRQLIETLKSILSSSNKALEKSFRGRPLQRARGFGLKRNALIVVGNLKLHELQPEVRHLLSSDRLNSLAQWTLQQLKDS